MVTTNDDGDYDAWVMECAGPMNIVMGRTYDDEYDYWQNAKDPALYSTAGRSIEGLPLRSNGFPEPLERLEIDTSRNPGRPVLRGGYIECVGSTMWLGPSFWSLTGADPSAVRAVRWLNIVLCQVRFGIQAAESSLYDWRWRSG